MIFFMFLFLQINFYSPAFSLFEYRKAPVIENLQKANSKRGNGSALFTTTIVVIPQFCISVNG